jgi:hypothetical protein
MLENAKAYELRMGSWSKLLALCLSNLSALRVKYSMWAAARAY